MHWIILAIVGLSVGPAFWNEYRLKGTVEALHRRIPPSRAVTIRDGRRVTVDETGLVPGDIVLLDVGEVVPARSSGSWPPTALECDEAALHW